MSHRNNVSKTTRLSFTVVPFYEQSFHFASLHHRTLFFLLLLNSSPLGLSGWHCSSPLWLSWKNVDGSTLRLHLCLRTRGNGTHLERQVRRQLLALSEHLQRQIAVVSAGVDEPLLLASLLADSFTFGELARNVAQVDNDVLRLSRRHATRNTLELWQSAVQRHLPTLETRCDGLSAAALLSTHTLTAASTLPSTVSASNALPCALGARLRGDVVKSESLAGLRRERHSEARLGGHARAGDRGRLERESVARHKGA